MRKRAFLYSLVLASLAAAATLPMPGAAKPAEPRIAPKAEELLRQMSDYLAGLDQFTVRAFTTLEMITPSDQSLDADREVEISVQRPDRVRVNSSVPDHDRQIYYDGKTVTIYSPGRKFYAVFPAPSTIDQTITAARAKGLELPLADLIQTRPYSVLMARVRHGYYIGKSLVGGVMCYHLAFRQKDLDWQIWIEDSDTPLPRRVVITDRSLPGRPRYAATLTQWDTSPTFAADLFTFVPPPDAQKIRFFPRTPTGAWRQRR